MSTFLTTLADSLAGEFDNREQAIAEPIWYVHLRLWQRPVPNFMTGSLTLFAEQANALYLDRPYRQRLMQFYQQDDQPGQIQVQYYAFKDPDGIAGAGAERDRLRQVTPDQVEKLPGCQLIVTQTQPLHFVATPPPNSPCYFTYQGEQRQVCLGFEVSQQHFLSFDKGVDIETGQALWGAMMGPYRYTRRQDFSGEWEESYEL